MKTYKNPEPFEVEIETVNGEKKILKGIRITPKDMKFIDEINKSKKSNIDKVVEQASYVFGEDKEWISNNVSQSILNELIKDFFEIIANPTKGKK